MAEGLLRRSLSEMGVDALVSSAGLEADGWEPTHEAVAVMNARAISIAEHISRKLTEEIVSGADLIIAMEPRHVIAAVEFCEDAWSKSFTLRELANRAERIGPRASDATPLEWIAKVSKDRARTEMLGDPEPLTVADPYGKDLAEYRETAIDIASELSRVIKMLWPGVSTPNS